MRRRGFPISRGRGFPVSRRHQTYRGTDLNWSSCLGWAVIIVVAGVVVGSIKEDGGQLARSALTLVAIAVGSVVAILIAWFLVARGRYREALAARDITPLARVRTVSFLDFGPFGWNQVVTLGYSPEAIWLTDGRRFASLPRPPRVTVKGKTITITALTAPDWPSVEVSPDLHTQGGWREPPEDAAYARRAQGIAQALHGLDATVVYIGGPRDDQEGTFDGPEGVPTFQIIYEPRMGLYRRGELLSDGRWQMIWQVEEPPSAPRPRARRPRTRATDSPA